MTSPATPWYRTLTGYHWLVLIVCTLGWSFDCLDQQIFALTRTPALGELIGTSETNPIVAEYSGYATSLMLIGWAIGGIIFGILGDKIGRAKTMVWTILFYSIFTGLCGLSTGVWDFLLYRFMTGLGVGGQFAVGVALVAETMPTVARSRALGMLQAVASLGNVAAAMIALGFGQLEAQGLLPGSAWRWMFAVGTIPAVLSVVIMMKLHEPEQWQADVGDKNHKKAGSLAELFGVPWIRRRAILGMLLASTGVVGLWGIGFFAIDLNRTVIRRATEEAAIQKNHGTLDMQFVAAAIRNPEWLPEGEEATPPIDPKNLLADEGQTEQLRLIYRSVLEIHAKSEPIHVDSIAERLSALSESSKNSESVGVLLQKLEILPDVPTEKTSFDVLATKLNTRQTEINSRVSRWGGMTSLLFNLGAFFGVYAFAIVTDRIGRRRTFTIAFLAAMASTINAFLFMDSLQDILWMVPLMGFCQLSLFGGYAIYFPELFPTRLRSTSISFCYNIGRFVAALGPYALGMLTSKVFSGFAEPMRYAGATMSLIFLFGIVIIWFMPETKGEPLPD